MLPAEMLPGAARCFQMLPGAPKCCQMVPNATDDPGCCQMGLAQMLPDAAREICRCIIGYKISANIFAQDYGLTGAWDHRHYYYLYYHYDYCYRFYYQEQTAFGPTKNMQIMFFDSTRDQEEASTRFSMFSLSTNTCHYYSPNSL